MEESFQIMATRNPRRFVVGHSFVTVGGTATTRHSGPAGFFIWD